jgi:uncharacterized protein YndB with AHSA1/START domain
MTAFTSTKETEIHIDPDVPLVRLVREFDATPETVFRAHTDPKLFAQWCGPRELENEIDVWDCRTGGEWRYVSRDGDGEEYWFRGCYHEVRPNELIVQTFTYEGFAEGVSLDTLRLEPLDGGRCRLTATSLVDSFEGRDAFVASGMETGINEGYQKLDELLAAG